MGRTLILNIARGINCADEGARNDLSDQNGHGTHVAGIAASKDDGNFYVGVAPGARIWAVKLGTEDFNVSNLPFGLDWVAAHSGTVDVVNMSSRWQGREQSRVVPWGTR